MNNAKIYTEGLFIVLEGADGSGKTTMREVIAQVFRSAGMEVVITREPGGTPVAEKLRAIVTGSEEEIDKHASLLMFLAARLQHLRHVIFPAVSTGKIVICDRYNDSTYVYQACKHNLKPMLSVLENMSELRVLSYRPDFTFFFDVDPQVSMDRTAHERTADNQMNQDGGLTERTTDITNYRARMFQASIDKPDSVIVVDANKTLQEVTEFVQRVASGIVAKRLLALDVESFSS